MPATIKISLDAEAEKIIREVKGFPLAMSQGMARALDYENQLTVSHIVADYLSFPKSGPTVAIGCRVQTNRLRGSIRASKAALDGDVIRSAIGSNVVYAAAQEFGADIPAHDIVPRNGRALRFMIGQRVVFASMVHMPAHRLPARGFVRRGIADRATDYTRSISAAVVSAWQGGI